MHPVAAIAMIFLPLLAATPLKGSDKARAASRERRLSTVCPKRAPPSPRSRGEGLGVGVFGLSSKRESPFGPDLPAFPLVFQRQRP